MTSAYNTVLTEAEEAEFLKWATKSGKIRDLADYDLRGAWKSGAAKSANGHLPDTYKKPSHPTFSNESIYARQALPGGTWGFSGGADTFTPSALNDAQYPNGQLDSYFQRVEPNVKLVRKK